MFVCEDCGKKHGINPFWWMLQLSRGPCEFCHFTRACADIHHSQLPPTRPDDPRLTPA